MGLDRRVHALLRRRGLYLLDRKGGYTSDAGQAMRAQDDPEAPTIDGADSHELANRNLSAPPEPEAVPPHEIEHYTGSVLSRRRYDDEMSQLRLELASKPIELRLAYVRQLARENHVDITGEERIIERRIAALERKLIDKAA